MINILENPFCTFSRMNGEFKRHFELVADGTIKDIGGSGHDNERFWLFDGGMLQLLSHNKEITSCFYLKESNGSQSLFEGFYMEKIPLKLVCMKNRSDLFELRSKLKHGSLISSGYLEVGDHTYGTINLVDQIFGKVIIGDYCSIAPQVDFILANHRIDLVSTYPFKDLNVFWSDDKIETDDHVSKGNIVIGNDVWIGQSSKIMPGVTIGDGAVIAANAIVTKNVEPYSVVAGNPAKHIKYRIENEDDRRKMQAIAWWDWSEKKVSDNVNKIVNPNIKAFIEEFYVEK